MTGINGMEATTLLLLAVLLFGDRMPEYSRTLATWVRNLRAMSEDAKTRLKEEVPEIQDLDWRKMDPRQYDPRRIIKDALAEDLGLATSTPNPGTPDGQSVSPGFTPGAAKPIRPFRRLEEGTPAPFDTDAT